MASFLRYAGPSPTIWHSRTHVSDLRSNNASAVKKWLCIHLLYPSSIYLRAEVSSKKEREDFQLMGSLPHNMVLNGPVGGRPLNHRVRSDANCGRSELGSSYLCFQFFVARQLTSFVAFLSSLPCRVNCFE